MSHRVKVRGTGDARLREVMGVKVQMGGQIGLEKVERRHTHTVLPHLGLQSRGWSSRLPAATSSSGLCDGDGGWKGRNILQSLREIQRGGKAVLSSTEALCSPA